MAWLFLLGSVHEGTQAWVWGGVPVCTRESRLPKGKQQGWHSLADVLE